ncbi:MAG: lytic polysaccharide monooxygenase [Clostridiales bacterium]|jgi:predicted carbohydrate-binding protein with CBM5 and CBM33 domain|nr:lytic polysaccharide monooxygenase [Clostridiales bacterium]
MRIAKLNIKTWIVIFAILLLFGLFPFAHKGNMDNAHAHGYIGGNSQEDIVNPDLLFSRSQLGRMGYNSNVGQSQYEPQSVEGPGNFPIGGPKDGEIASGSVAPFANLNQQSSTRWAKINIVPGKLNVRWYMTAPHVTLGFQYWITKDDWNQNAPLTRDTFEKLQDFDLNLQIPSVVYSHDIEIPAHKLGYHVILGIWDIGDTPAAFYNVVDVWIHADSSTIKEHISLGEDTDGGGNSGEGGNGGGDFSIDSPQTWVNGSVVHWNAVEGATSYNVLHNGNVQNQTNTSYSCSDWPGIQYVMIQAKKDNNVGAWTAWITLTGGSPDIGDGNDGMGETKLSTPTGLKVTQNDDSNTEEEDNLQNVPSPPRLTLTGKLLTWTDANYATSYHAVINGIHQDLGPDHLFVEIPYTAGKHSIMVCSKNDQHVSQYSTFSRTILDEYDNAPILDTPSIKLIETSGKNSTIKVANHKVHSKQNAAERQSSYIVSHNGEISFFTGNSVSLDDLGLTTNDIKTGKHDVRIQAVNGFTSSEWSTPLSIDSINVFPKGITDNSLFFFVILCMLIIIAAISIVLQKVIRKPYNPPIKFVD